MSLNFSIGGTPERSTSAQWIFIMDFPQKEVSQDTLGVWFVFDWQMSSFSQTFGKTFWESFKAA